jgi:hypothetical protein
LQTLADASANAADAIRNLVQFDLSKAKLEVAEDEIHCLKKVIVEKEEAYNHPDAEPTKLEDIANKDFANKDFANKDFELLV